LLHFVLFVFDCRAVHKWRRARSLERSASGIKDDVPLEIIHSIWKNGLRVSNATSTTDNTSSGPKRYVWKDGLLGNSTVIPLANRLPHKERSIWRDGLLGNHTARSLDVESQARPYSTDMGIGHTISTSEDDTVSVTSPPPYSQVVAEIPG
jgi:hypothetical protein